MNRNFLLYSKALTEGIVNRTPDDIRRKEYRMHRLHPARIAIDLPPTILYSQCEPHSRRRGYESIQ